MDGHQGYGCTGQFLFGMRHQIRNERMLRSRDRAEELNSVDLGERQHYCFSLSVMTPGVQL